jgi:hypothetical protein
VCALVLYSQACASGTSALRADQERGKLRSAMQVPVATREKRDEQSRLLATSVEDAGLEGLDRPSVRAAFGPGKSCDLQVCRNNGFTDGDWYYEIGVMENEQVKQLPLLLLSFDPHERVKRVFTFTTH